MTDVSLSERIARSGLDWIVPQWDAPDNVHALVTTRNGGVSVQPYATMNVGVASSGRDRPDAVAQNRARLRAFLPSEPIWLRQVHGATVAGLDGTRSGSLLVADAAVTRVPGVVCAVLVADCVPVLLADRGATVVGIAHAGWRGLAAGVIEATIARMQTAPADIVAWLGPAIGPRAFEVGADVHAAFGDVDAGACAAFTPLREGKWHADLYELARRRLGLAGVHSVAGGGWCTYTDAARFFSYRRDGETGRMAATIWLEAASPA